MIQSAIAINNYLLGNINALLQLSSNSLRGQFCELNI